MLIILLWMKKLKPIFKLLNLKLMTESELLSIRIFLVKVTLKNGWEEYLLSILCSNPLTCKIKDLNEERIIGSFNEKELLLSKL